jgi:predicted permease
MNNNIYLLKQAWMGLSAKKGFLVTVTTTLGLTLGALLCILTLAYVMISKPLPYPEQEHLYQVDSVLIDQDRGPIARAYEYPVLMKLFNDQTVFSQSALVRYEEGVLASIPAQPEVRNTFVTSGWFDLLGSKMALGRPFGVTEKKDSFNPVAVLSYDVWENEFNSDETILEQTVTLGTTNFKVVGVLAKTFIEPQLNGTGIKTDIFLPWDYNTINLNPRRRDGFGSFSNTSRFVGKLDSQLSLSQIEQTLTTPLNAYWKENVAQMSGFEDWHLEMELQTFKDAILGDTKSTVWLLLAGVVGLILIACTNITNLFMSRTADQQRELAIQAAVGANKHQLFKALFAQSGLVVFISAAIALTIATGGFWILQQYLALRLPRVDELTINSVTLGAALFIALFLGLFFARISARMINYQTLNATIQSSGKGTGIQVSPTVRRWLIISQVAIVTLLVFINIGLFRDSLKVINQPLGFETDNISALTLKINSAGNISQEEAQPFINELKDKLMALPQIEDVSQTVLPLSRPRSIFHGHESVLAEEHALVVTKYTDDRYFQLIEQPLIEGDFFSEVDFNDEARKIIINDVYADKLVADGLVAEGNVIGTTIVLLNNYRHTVTGIVKSVKMPTESDIPMRSYIPTTNGVPQFLIKLKPHQTLPRELVATMAQSVSRQFFVSELEPLNDQRDRLLFTQYTTAITSAVLAVLTFFLATIGLYGILNYATQMRRLELGTRLAIGAKRKDIIGLVIKDNAGAVGIGTVISVIIMLVLSIGFPEALSGHDNMQLVSLLSATLGLISIMTLVACYWPLRPIVNSPVIRSLRGN